MPLLKLETNVALPEDQKKSLLTALSKIVATTIGKPEVYVMVTMSNSAMQMAGVQGSAAFVDIRSIGGLSHEVNRKLSKEICQLLKDSISVPPGRVYLNFTDVPGANWGANSSTFA